MRDDPERPREVRPNISFAPFSQQLMNYQDTVAYLYKAFPF